MIEKQKAKRLKKALVGIYGDAKTQREILTEALADIRHACDCAGLSLAEIDRDAHARYLNEKTPQLQFNFE